MTPATDPYRILGLNPGATPAEIKRAYRRLVKAYHPDSAGERALPRFLAIQAAYERLTGSGPGSPATRDGSASRDGSAGRRGSPPPPPPPSRPWSAEAERARAAREGFRQRSTRSGPRPGGSAGAPGEAAGGPAAGGSAAGRGARPGPAGRTAGEAAGPGAGPRPSGAGRGSGRRGRPKATIGSTSYDGAENEPFEPGWGGAGWYGAASGTYWTINPKEYADPRKHGPEYLARARRGRGRIDDEVTPEPAPAGDVPPDDRPPASGGNSRSHEAEDPSPAMPGPGGPAPATGSTSAETGSVAHEAERPPARSRPGDEPRPTFRSGPSTAEAAGVRTPPDPAPTPFFSAARFGALAPGRVVSTWRGRLLVAALAWFPISLAIFGAHGEVTGCSRFLASCTDLVAWSVWVPQLVAFAVLLASPRLAWIAASGSVVLLALTLPVAAVLTTGSGGRPPTPAGTQLLLVVMAVGWLIGIGIALSGRIPLPPWRATRVR